MPVPGWFQRAEIVLKSVTVDRGEALAAPEEADTYCYGTPPRVVGEGNDQDGVA